MFPAPARLFAAGDEKMLSKASGSRGSRLAAPTSPRSPAAGPATPARRLSAALLHQVLLVLRAGLAGMLALELQRDCPAGPLRVRPLHPQPTPRAGLLKGKWSRRSSPRRGFPLRNPPSGHPPPWIAPKGETPLPHGYCGRKAATPRGPSGGTRASPMAGLGLRRAPLAADGKAGRARGRPRPAPSHGGLPTPARGDARSHQGVLLAGGDAGSSFPSLRGSCAAVLASLPGRCRRSAVSPMWSV